MSRIRTVKPELFTHEALFEAEKASGLPLRLAFIALLTVCDREGRFRWQPRRLKASLMPYDDIDLSEVFNALRDYEFIQQYEYAGQCYGCIPSWSNHQRINKHEAGSVLPALGGVTLVASKKRPKNPEITMDSTSVCEACTRDPSDGLEVADVCTCMHVGKGRERNGREEEKEGNGMERNGSFVACLRPVGVTQTAIQQVFKYWQQVMNHPQAQLDPKRQALIRKALILGYSVEQLCEAIRGCSLTPHNQGDNDRGQRYDGLHIILRDAEQIDRFSHNAHNPPRALSTADRLSRNNADVLKRWADSNVLEEGVYESH